MRRHSTHGILVILAISTLVGCARSNPDFRKLKKDGVPLGQIDLINGGPPVVRNGAVPIPQAPVEIVGWAVDGRAMVTGSSLYLNVNGKPIPCEYGSSRPDVASALHREDLTYSGYRCKVPEDRLQSGLNTMQPMLLTKNRTYLAGSAVLLDSSPR